jgi:hypothetical protein
LVRWEVRAIFDHDYTHHLLIQQWRWNWDNECFVGAGYSLWYASVYEEVLFVDEWPSATKAPHTKAAAHVMKWEKLVAEFLAHPNN